MYRVLMGFLLSFCFVSMALGQLPRDDGRRIDVSNVITTTAVTNDRWSTDFTVAATVVSRAEYDNAVAELAKAVLAAEAAHSRLEAIRPDTGSPNPVDCMFHPWHEGCQDLWQSVEKANGPAWVAAVSGRETAASSGGPPAGSQFKIIKDIFKAWGGEKILDKAFDITVCLVKTGQPDGGWEGPKGLRRIGKCFDSQTAPGGTAGTWTAWLNVDGPGGVGDFEEKQNLVKAGKVCAAPIAIECQTTSGVDWQRSGQAYTCTLDRGGICVNSNQKSGEACNDYRVRFLCP